MEWSKTTDIPYSLEGGESLAVNTFGFHFRKEREAAQLTCPELADELSRFQFRDIRALAATDIGSAGRLPGHPKENITKRVCRRGGETVRPI